MSDRELLQKYVQAGVRLIPLKGFSAENPNKNYKAAKTPATGVEGFTNGEFKGFPIESILHYLEKGFWVGGVVPKDTLFIDAEGLEATWLSEYFQKIEIEPAIHNTNNGVHYGFKYQENGIRGESKAFCKLGWEVTYRVAGKNYLVLAPSNGRTWGFWKDFSDLPDLPKELYPLGNSQDDTLDAIVEQLGFFYRKGFLNGFEDIELSLFIACNAFFASS